LTDAADERSIEVVLSFPTKEAEHMTESEVEPPDTEAVLEAATR